MLFEYLEWEGMEGMGREGAIEINYKFTSINKNNRIQWQ